MKKLSLINLYFIFVRIGAILIGGGYVILPIVKNEFVDRRELIEKDDLVNFFTISQSLPGIIAANISMFIGYKLRGKLGAITAMLGIITAPFICILVIASILGRLADNPYITGVMNGVGIAVIALIMLTVREIWQNSKRDKFFYIIFLLSLTSLLIFHIPPIETIILFTILGILIKLGGKK